MDWVKKINEVIEYTEKNLSEEIDKDKISSIMACPYSVFQRSFVQIAGITLGEYIRQRKLTKAACDILNSDEKLIDIALKYGYESADAFTVAFKKLHGIPPSAVRKPEVKLRFYSRLRFILSIKGVEEMDYKVIEKSAFKVIGRRCITNPEGEPGNRGTWKVANEDGSVEKMLKLMNPIKPFLGLNFGYGEDRSNDNMVAIEYSGNYDTKALEGLQSYEFPSLHWLIFTDEGKINERPLERTWDRIYREFMPNSEYKQAQYPTIEIYTERDVEKNYCKLEIWVPIINTPPPPPFIILLIIEAVVT